MKLLSKGGVLRWHLRECERLEGTSVSEAEVEGDL